MSTELDTLTNYKRRIAITFGVVALILTISIWWSGLLTPAQKLEGRLVDYHEIYDGLWDVACDTRVDGSDKRCYLQYVDVYRPRPEFAAAMVEVVFHVGRDGLPDPHVRFDIEPGLSFQKSRIVTMGGASEQVLDLSDCPKNTCRFNGNQGREILKHWRNGSTLRFEIDEGRGVPSVLNWPLQNMDAILDDFAIQRRSRELP